MSEIQHKSLKDELLYLIGRASSPLSSAELYEKCELADEVAKVAKAVATLQSDGKIVRAEGEGRARYKLADGVAAPAPAGKTGRSKAVQKDDAAGLLTVGFPLAGIRPAPEPGLPNLDIPTLGDPVTAGLDQVEAALKKSPAPARVSVKEALAGKQPGADAARLADAIIARLKRQLAPAFVGMDMADGPDRVAVHIHIEQVDIHLGGL